MTLIYNRYPHIAVFLLAVVVHLLVIGPSFWDEEYPEGSADEARYVFYAQEIRAGRGMHAPGYPDQPTAYVMPGTPLFFAVVGPGSLVQLRLAQLGVAGVVAVVTFQIGREVGGRDAVGWLSAVFLLCNLAWVRQPGFLVTETLFVFFLVVAVWALIHNPQDFRFLALAAVMFGLAWLTRGAVFFSLVFAFLYLWWRVGLVKTFLAGCLLLAVISPWVIRNYAAFNAFVPTSTQSGHVLAGAYNDVIYADPWANGWINPNEYFIDEIPAQIRADEIAYSNHLTERALQWIQENPDKLPQLWVAHIFGFVRPWPKITRNGLELFWELGSWVIGFNLLLYGWLVAWRQRSQALLLISLVILGGFVTGLVFFAIPRYRVPFSPLLAVIEAVAGTRLWEYWRGSVQVEAAAQQS